MNSQRSKRKVQFIVNHNQIRFRLKLKFPEQASYCRTTQVHIRFGLGKYNLLVTYRHPCSEGPTLPIPDLKIICKPINGQEAQIMRRELIFDTRIAKPND